VDWKVKPLSRRREKLAVSIGARGFRTSHVQLILSFLSLARSTTSHSLLPCLFATGTRFAGDDRDHGPTQSPLSESSDRDRDGELGSDCSAASATLNASRRSGVGSGEEGVAEPGNTTGGRKSV